MDEPLTPEEIDSVRRLHPSGDCDHVYSGCREAQWLATLDAARAAAPAGETNKDETISRLSRALRVATHKPHDQDSEPDPDSGFPVCSVCGAIQTAPPSPDPVAGLRGEDVHREWRDGMLAQGREVAPERMAWETLSEQDRLLDDRIAERRAALLDSEGLDGLDVERLMEAMQNVENAGQGWGTVGEAAALYAAEYARLSGGGS